MAVSPRIKTKQHVTTINRLWNTSTIIRKLVKAIATLLHTLRQDFFKATRHSILLDGIINLIGLADWLERCLKTYFNPLAEIVAFQGQENLWKLHYSTNTGKSKFNNSLTLNTLNFNDHSDDEDKLEQTNF